MQFSFAKGRFAACCLLLGAACAAAGFALGAALSARPSAGKAPAPSVRLLPAAISQPSPPQSQPLPQRLVCLTFDDGPSRTTPAVLEALAAEGVPAWAAQSAANLATCGVLPAGSSLGEALTRGEAAQMLCSALELLDSRDTGWF